MYTNEEEKKLPSSNGRNIGTRAGKGEKNNGEQKSGVRGPGLQRGQRLDGKGN